jgi:hypothetical protein
MGKIITAFCYNDVYGDDMTPDESSEFQDAREALKKKYAEQCKEQRPEIEVSE